MTQNLLEKKLTEIIFNIFDTESTGNNSFRIDEPIEVAYVCMNLEKGILDKYQTMVHSDLIIHPAAVMTHGITNEEFKTLEKISYKEMLAQILPAFDQVVPVAHNIAFDYSMIPELRDLDLTSIDTLALAKKLYQVGDLNKDEMPLTSHKMQEIRYWLNIHVDTLGYDPHRALADVLVTAEVFKNMLVKFMDVTNNPNATLQDLTDYINAPTILEICTYKKFEGKTYQEAIKECLQKGDNYFDWLLGKQSEDPVRNKAVIDTIKYWFKQYNYDPALSGVGKKDGAKNFFKKSGS